jgi:hypothetical protein
MFIPIAAAASVAVAAGSAREGGSSARCSGRSADIAACEFPPHLLPQRAHPDTRAGPSAKAHSKRQWTFRRRAGGRAV